MESIREYEEEDEIECNVPVDNGQNDMTNSVLDHSSFISQCIQDLELLSEMGGKMDTDTSIRNHLKTTHKDRMLVLEQLILQQFSIKRQRSFPSATDCTTTDVTHRLGRELSLCRAEMGMGIGMGGVCL